MFALVEEATRLRAAPPVGQQVLVYAAILTILPVVIAGMAVTAGLHGGALLSRPPAFWILTAPMSAWAIIGWWTLGSTVRRWVKR